MIIEKIKGIVRKVESINEFLTFVTFESIKDGWDEYKVPFYSRLNPDITNKVAEITTQRSGLFRRKVEQKISGNNYSYSVSLTQSQLNSISENYRNSIN